MIPPENFHSCHHCQKFTIDLKQRRPLLRLSSGEEEIPSDIFFFDATLKDVLDGFADGCTLCTWLDSLWKGSSSSSQARYDILTASENASSIAVCAETYSMSLVDRYPVDEILFFGLWERNAPLHPNWGKCRVFSKCSIDIFTTEGDVADRLIRNRPINRFPASSESFTLARQWLQKCQNSHAKCSNVSQTYMPLRVLRIRRGCGSCDFHITIETTTKNESVEPFAALSYCWGGDQPYKTTKARMDSGDMALQWHKLPRSVQDAVKTTAALGLQCLWAGSLCILQDDEADKVLQIADMARIYSQATVTITASRASRAVDGFLGEINLTTQTRLAVRLPFRCFDNDQRVGSAYLIHIEGSRSRSEPIDSHAWTLQERYLSNRILEFGSQQIRWTCATSSSLTSPPNSSSTTPSSDNYTDGWKWDKNAEDHNSQILYLHGELLADLEEFAVQRSSTAWVREWLHSRWQTVLSEYTPRLLSVPTDRILGISGVAEMFGTHFRNEGRDEKEEYLAGMWKSSLPSSLCWHAVVAEMGQGAKQQQEVDGLKDTLPPRPEVYQGPSWSWTSVNCHVLFIFGRACERGCRAVLLDVDLRLADQNAKYGSVTHGILTLKGRMRKCSWNIADTTLHVDRDGDLHCEDKRQRTDNTATKRLRLVTVYPDTSDFPNDVSHKRGLLIPVCLLEIGNCVGLKRRGPIGLILEAVTVLGDQHPPRFRRLGLFHIDARRSQKPIQLASRASESAELEDEMDFFEGHVAVICQIE
ncbi:heterokaryon incompatibility protein-domain-containing protein [Xylariaceae sp. AK1471]|nr:heterokaryon incompatibility protein-domain-containing protein [Xylariaceae sp. AK1471]